MTAPGTTGWRQAIPIDDHAGEHARAQRLGALGMLFLAMLFWSGNQIVGRAVNQDIPPLTLSLLRWIVALAVLLPFAAGHLKRDRAALIAAWKPVLLLGITGVSLFNTLVYRGLHNTTAANALLLQAAIPALVLLLDRLVFKLRAPRAQLLGVLISTLGVLAIVAHGSPARLLALHLGEGDALVLLAVCVWAIYTSFLKLWPAIHPLSFLAATFVVGAVFLLPAPLIEADALAGVRWTPRLIGAIAYVGIFPSIIAYLLFNLAVARIGAAPAGQTLSLMPLFGALSAAAILSEPLFAYHFAGMGLILGGIALTYVAGAAPGRPRTK